MKKSFLIALLLPLILNAKLEQIENNYLAKAIAENNFSKFSEILKNSKDPFKKRSLWGDAEEQAIRSSVQEIQYEIANSKGCKDSFVQELLKYEFKPLLATDIHSGGKDLSIWQQLCPKTIEALMPPFNDEDQIKISEQIIDAAMNLMKKVMNQTTPVNDKDLKNAADSVALVSNKVKLECKEYDIKNSWCLIKDKISDLQKSVKTDLEKVEKDQKAEAEANSTNGLQERYCEIMSNIQTAQNAIDRQNEIGKTSGVMDKSVLHSNGTMIVDLKREAKEIQEVFKSKFKTTLKQNCK